MQKDFVPLSAQIPVIAHGPQREDRIIFLSSIDSKALLDVSQPQLKQLLTEANEYSDLRLKDLIKDVERQIRIKSIDAIPKQYLMHQMTQEQAKQLIKQCSQHDDDRMKQLLTKMRVTLKYIENKQRQKLSWWQFIYDVFTGEDLETKMKRQGLWPGYKNGQEMRSSQERSLTEFSSKKKNE